jgi:hypothetical protein
VLQIPFQASNSVISGTNALPNQNTALIGETFPGQQNKNRLTPPSLSEPARRVLD